MTADGGRRPGRRRTGTLVLNHGTWALRVMVGGKWLWRSLGTKSRREAEARRAGALVELGVVERGQADILARVRDRLETVEAKAGRQRQAQAARMAAETAARKRLPLEGTWGAFLASAARPDTGAAALRQYEFCWRQFVGWLSGQGIRRLVELSPAVMDQYGRHLRARGIAAKTHNNHLAVLGLVLKHLPTTEGIPSGVMSGAARRRDVPVSRRDIPPETLGAILEAATGELRTLLLIGIYTGLRLKDAALLDWAAVDLAAGLLRVTPAKMARRTGGERLLIPIHRELRTVLEETPADGRHGPVLSETAAQYARRPLTIAQRVQRLMESAGLDLYGTPDPGGSVRRRPLYGYHSLRHTAVSLLAAAGVPMAATQAIVGHHSRAMTDRYTHVGTDALRAAVDALPSLSTPASPSLRQQIIDEIAELGDSQLHNLLQCIKLQKQNIQHAIIQ